MRWLLTFIGAFVTVLAIAGAMGIGHFRIYYGPHAPVCKTTN